MFIGIDSLTSRPWVGKLQPADHFGPLPVFVNKVLLQHNHAAACTFCRGMATKPKRVTTFYRSLSPGVYTVVQTSGFGISS